jgi:hypothetical protein
MSTARVTSKGPSHDPSVCPARLEDRSGGRSGLRGDVREVCRAESREKKAPFRPFWRALPATRPFAGKEAIRDEVGRDLGEALQDKTS